MFDSIPHGFTLISNPRPVSSSCTSSVVGGGTAFLIREPFTLLSSLDTTFKSFLMPTVTLKLPHSKLWLFNIYRPPSSSAKSRDTASFSQFLDDFKLLSLPYLLHHIWLSHYRRFKHTCWRSNWLEHIAIYLSSGSCQLNSTCLFS